MWLPLQFYGAVATHLLDNTLIFNWLQKHHVATMPSEWSGGHIFRVYSTLERHLERQVSKLSINKILELCITRVKKKILSIQISADARPQQSQIHKIKTDKRWIQQLFMYICKNTAIQLNNL